MIVKHEFTCLERIYLVKIQNILCPFTTGNGKRSDIGLAEDLESLRRGEGVLPGFESPEQEEIGGRTRVDDGYEPRQNDEDLPSYGGRQINQREDSDYADRRERLLEVLVSTGCLQ